MDHHEKARLKRMQAFDHALAMAKPKVPRVHGEKSFTFSAPAAHLFRELAATLQKAAHPKLSQSQLVELLVAHWEEHSPDSRWVFDFEFVTKRGRPRTSS